MNLHRSAYAAIAFTVGLGHALPTLAATTTAAPAPASPGLYGFCFERRQSPATSYVSGTFEIPRDNVQTEIRVMFVEFAKDTAHRYGVAVAALNG